MDLGRKILSDVVMHSKYYRYLDDKKRRETFDEMVTRRMDMDIKKFPALEQRIRNAYDGFVRTKKVFPSMRSFQFAGKAIETTASRMFNCCYLPVNDVHSFSEIMFILLGGSGVGYSVQEHHVEMLPTIKETLRPRKYLVQDSIEGWADSVKVLMRAYFEGRSLPRFDFTAVRKKGSRLVTSGGKAPGPEPLMLCLSRIEAILRSVEVDSKLTTLQCHDILCFIADAVYAGGIRRAAMIAFFTHTDVGMLYAKTGDWYDENPQRSRANNSAVLLRGAVTRAEYDKIMYVQSISGSGEPGIYWTDDKEMLSNPCVTDDTLVETSLGVLPVKELIGRKFDLVVNGKLVPVKSHGFFATGTKEVFEVTTSNATVNATGNHLFLTDSGWKTVEDIVVSEDSISLANKTLGSLYGFSPNKLSLEKGYLVGACYGDGYYDESMGQVAVWENSTKDFDSLVTTISDCISSVFGDRQQKYLDRVALYFNQHDEYKYEYNSVLLRDLVSPFFSRSKELDLFALYREDASFRRGFLQGMFDSDGSVQGLNSSHGISIRLSSINLGSLKIVQQILKEWGIISTLSQNRREAGYRELPTNKGDGSTASYFCQASHELIISRSAMLDFQKHIGFSDANKRDKLAQALNSYKRAMNKNPTHSKVLSIKKIGVANVYDITVDTSSGADPVFSANGLIAHNCVEAALRAFSFCNLCEINCSLIGSQEEFNEAAKAAAFIGTLQASYTDFHYLRDIWRTVTEEDALIGVGLTGIASKSFLSLNFREAAGLVVATNRELAEEIGINPAARCTLIKPSGTTSSVLGCSSGVHDWHDYWYVRRIRIGKHEPIWPYLNVWIPDCLVDDVTKPYAQSVLEIPVKAPSDAVIRTDSSAFDLLEREKTLYQDWVLPGHNRGTNTHSISITVSYRPAEYDGIVDWMWDNRDSYAGISLLPYSGTVYQQMPFESISEEEYQRRYATLSEIYLEAVEESDDLTDLSGEAACAGGACTI